MKKNLSVRSNIPTGALGRAVNGHNVDVSKSGQFSATPVAMAVIAIALIAWGIRVDIASRYAVGMHPDEEIIGCLAALASERGFLSANWQPFTDTIWGKETYQFSPYSLFQESVGMLATGCGWLPNTINDHIMLARYVNCILAALTSLLVFLTTRKMTNSVRAGLFAQVTIALGFLNVQDSIYARVEPFLALLTTATACLAVHIATTRFSIRLFYGLSFLAGLTIATKYNAVPVLVFVVIVHFMANQAGAIWTVGNLRRIIASIFAALLGFVAGTPELLINPSPFFIGIQSEARHYATGHLPHEAFGFWDNNLFYFIQYMTQLGFGYVPASLFVYFIIHAFIKRQYAPTMIASYLMIAMMMGILPKVRFERNWEIFYPVMCVAAGAGANLLLGKIPSTLPSSVRNGVGIILLIGLIFQPIVTIARFRAIIAPEVSMALVAVKAYETSEVATAELRELYPPSPIVQKADRILLVSNDDMFARRNRLLWRDALSEFNCTLSLVSPWKQHGYIFSTVDEYHGPMYLFVYDRKM